MSKIHLLEHTLLGPKNYSKRELQLSEASQLVDGTPYKALAVYRFRFTRPDEENVNGRIYTTRLWAKLIPDFKSGRTTAGLMDHPVTGPGSPKDRWCIWRNMDFSDNGKTVSADCYLLDNEWGRTALATLEAGGDIGLSTSGYGDFLPDGKTIDPETYELERVADWVEEPSYEIFGKMEDRATPVSTSANTIQEGVAVHKDALPLKEHTMKKTLREQRSFEITMKRILEEVSAIKDPRQRKLRAQEATSFYEEDDPTTYKADFEKVCEEAEDEVENLLTAGNELPKVVEASNATKTALTEAQVEIAALKEQLSALSKRYENATSMLDEAAAFSKESSKMIESVISEKKQMVSIADYNKLREYAEKASRLFIESKKTNVTLQESNQVMVARLQTLTEAEVSRNRAIKERTDSELANTRSQELINKLRENREASRKEQELLESANDLVLSAYTNAVKAFPVLKEYREDILSKNTLLEAEKLMLDIRGQHTPLKEMSSGAVDLSKPLTWSSYKGTPVTSPYKAPKGCL